MTGPQLACSVGAGSAGADATESASDALRRSVTPTVKAKRQLHDHAIPGRGRRLAGTGTSKEGTDCEP